MKYSYLFLFAQFIVSSVLIIMVNFIFVKTQWTELILAAKINFLEQNGVRALELS